MTINFELIAGKITTNLTGGQLKQISHFDHLKKKFIQISMRLKWAPKAKQLSYALFFEFAFGSLITVN